MKTIMVVGLQSLNWVVLLRMPEFRPMSQEILGDADVPEWYILSHVTRRAEEFEMIQ